MRRSILEGTMLRVVFYSHDTYGLGHFRRCLKLGWALAEHLPGLQGAFLSGSPWTDAFELPTGFRVVRIPAAIKRGPGEYAPRHGTGCLDDLVAGRSRTIRSLLADFQPDLFLVDNVPVGMHGEVRTALECLGDRRPLSVLILRDILDDPASVTQEWEAVGAESAIEDFFAEIWCFGDEDDVSTMVEQGPLKGVTKPIVTCGHLGWPPASRRARRSSCRLASGGEKAVVVTTGGGGDGQPLVEAYVAAARDFHRINSHVILGPDFPDRAASQILDNASSHLRVERFLPDLDRCFDRADLVISMAGYNTVCEILASGSRAILVPRTYPRREQLMRAERLAARGRVTFLHPRSLSPYRLAREIEGSLAQSGRFIPESQAGGRIAADRTARLLGLESQREAG